MNWRLGIVGSAVATCAAVGLSVGTQLVVWGNEAPTWYAAVAFAEGLTLGTIGWWAGTRWPRWWWRLRDRKLPEPLRRV